MTSRLVYARLRADYYNICRGGNWSCSWYNMESVLLLVVALYTSVYIFSFMCVCSLLLFERSRLFVYTSYLHSGSFSCLYLRLVFFPDVRWSGSVFGFCSLLCLFSRFLFFRYFLFWESLTPPKMQEESIITTECGYTPDRYHCLRPQIGSSILWRHIKRSNKKE